MAKANKKKSGGKKKHEAKASKSPQSARPMNDDDLSAGLDVTAEALEVIGRIAGEAAGRLRALAEVHRRRVAGDDE